MEAACWDAANVWFGKTEDNQSKMTTDIILIAALLVIFYVFYFLIPCNGVQAEHAEAGRGGAEGEDLGAGQHHQEQPRYSLFFIFFRIIFQHCFICFPSDSTVPTDAGIEPRTVAADALAVRRSNL
jgi:hypothetical protein